MKYLIFILFISCSLKKPSPVYPQPIIHSGEEACRKDTQELMNRIKVLSPRIDSFISLRDSFRNGKFKTRQEAERALEQSQRYEDSVQVLIKEAKSMAGGEQEFWRLVVEYGAIKGWRSKRYK